MRKVNAYVAITVFAFVLSGWAQQSRSATNAVTALPKASLWRTYLFQFQSNGDNGPHHWHLMTGVLPRGLTLSENGMLIGEVSQEGQWNFTLAEIDHVGKQEVHRYALKTEPPLSISWDKRAAVNGNRIDGSIKVSNSTGRSFDLTFIVLAVNGIGRATAIGYQHFPLKAATPDQELPFGETLSPGDYAVNVDVVGEELQSKMIFRTRLVAPNESVTQGP